MDVSVCIVSLNSIKQLRKCLKTLDAGIAPLSYEVIVVDNNSRDGTQFELKKNFKNVPFLSELFGKNVEESLLAADFKVKKNGNKTDFIFNPLSILTPGKTRNFFDIWE